MKKIDLSTWDRKEFFECYSTNKMPMFGITTPLDVTKVYNFAKRENISFYFSLGYALFRALKDVEDFNIRVIDGELVVNDNNWINFVCLRKGERNIRFIDVEYKDDVVEFCKLGKINDDNQNTLFSPVSRDNNCIAYITCLPWYECTDITHPKSGDLDDFIPRFAWDKIKDVDGRKIVNFNVEANHRTIDGYAIGMLLEKLNYYIDKIFN